MTALDFALANDVGSDRMVEWLILVILVPAVVVPVVLLVGFAGCDRVFGLHRLEPNPPIITATQAAGLSTIFLAWTFEGAAENFQIERTKLPDGTIETFDAPSFAIVDSGLQEGTLYLYRVRAVKVNGEYTDWSGPASAKTFSFQATFEWKNYEEVFSRDSAGWAGMSIVQRIEAVRLSTSGTQVRVTLRAATNSDASVKRIYMSRPDPDPSKDPYDSGTDLIPITTTPFVVAANTTLELPVVDYSLSEGAPLLIAIDFADTPLSGIRTSDHAVGSSTIHVPTEEAQTFFKPTTEAAATADRSGFSPTAGINFVYKIEVVAP